MELTRPDTDEQPGSHGVELPTQQSHEGQCSQEASMEDLRTKRPRPFPPDFVATCREIVKEGLWGFVAVRSACYDDEEKWAKFKDKWQEVVNLGFRRNDGEEGLEDAESKFEIRWIENKDLAGADLDILREYVLVNRLICYLNLTDATTRRYNAVWPFLPRGLQHCVFLSITDKVVDSVLGNKEPTVESEYWSQDVPFVVVLYSDGTPVLDEDEDDGCFEKPFMVALEVIADVFWPLVGADTGALDSFTRFIKEDEVWWCSTYPLSSRGRQRARHTYQIRRSKLPDQVINLKKAQCHSIHVRLHKDSNPSEHSHGALLRFRNIGSDLEIRQ